MATLPRREFLFISNLAGVRVGVLNHDVDDLVHTERLDQTETLKFRLPASHDKVGLLAVDRTIFWRSRTFNIIELEETREGSITWVSVTAEAVWYELGRSRWTGTLLLDQVTPRIGLDTILASTGWVASGASTTDTATFSMEADDATHLDLIRRWAKVTGKFLRFEHWTRQVQIVDDRGVDRGMQFRYGRNLKTVRRRIAPPTITRLYAYGADDLSFAGINGGLEYVEDMSYYTALGVDLDAIGPDGRTNRERLTREVVLKDTSFVTEGALKAWALTQIGSQGQPIITYEMTVADLSELTGVTEHVECGDTVRVFDPAFAIDLESTVVGLEQRPKDPSKNKIELAVLPKLRPDPSQSVGRGDAGDNWFQFVGPIMASFPIRNNATYTVARIPLRFRQGGRYHTTIDLAITGVGASGGDVTIQVFDQEADATVKQWTIPYSDGQTTRLTASFAKEVIQAGTKDLRLRVTVAANGGASVTNGVDLTVEEYLPDGDTESDPLSWWVMAQRAVRQTPPGGASSQSWAYVGQIVRTFVVPDNVTEVTIQAAGASGYQTNSGKGGRVTATVPVVSGETLYIGVGGEGGNQGQGGSFGGGEGGGPSGNKAQGGGGCSAVWRTTPTWPPNPGDLLVVAPGGGGDGNSIGFDDFGGDGGFFVGTDGGHRNHPVGSSALAKGGTQYAGGAAGVGEFGLSGTAGSFLQGGNGATGSGSLTDYGGGGGGGLYGGGGGGGGSANVSGGGGGGSGYVKDGAYDLLIEDAVISADDGAVTISWTPVL